MATAWRANLRHGQLVGVAQLSGYAGPRTAPGGSHRVPAPATRPRHGDTDVGAARNFHPAAGADAGYRARLLGIRGPGRQVAVKREHAGRVGPHSPSALI